MNPRQRLAEVEAELRNLHEAAGDAALTDEQQTRWDELSEERGRLPEGDTPGTGLLEQIRRDDERRTLARSFAGRPGHTESGDGATGAPNVQVKRSPFDVLEDRSLRGRDLTRALRDANLRAVEGKDLGGSANEKYFESVLTRHGSNVRWAENVLARSRPEYAEGFAKILAGAGETLSNEERAAMTVGTNTAGGYLVPTHLDPTLVLTNAGSSNVMRQYATVVTLTEGNVWHGVTTAGATASWDAEVAEVSDDTPAVASTSISVFKGAGFIQASIEAFEDITGLSSSVLAIFADAKDRLEGAAHMTGSGSGQPTGLFTAINASASLQVTSTTAATIGEVDVHALYRALPVRWRAMGSFVANPLYSLAVKRLGTAVSSSYSGDLREPVATRWLDKPVIESDDAPTTQTTTALDQEIVFADLRQYVIVDKPGSTSIELIPHMFHTSNNLPSGTRAWYMHFRSGGGMPNLAAGRILVDKTSA